jgi:hypothetical protein
MFIRTKTDGVEIRVALPLTATSGKVRVKRRDMLNQYGIPVATCQTPFAQNQYIEWQIGYDVVVNETEKLGLTTLPGIRFTGANEKIKALYELSEYIFWLTKWNIIKPGDLRRLAKTLQAIPPDGMFDVHPDLPIRRSDFIPKEINGVSFLFARVEYPLVVHKFAQYEIVAEIITREKQRAIGVQPMLYFCFPVTELASAPGNSPLLGRPARSKEHADFMINRANASVFLQLLRLFGMLSENHRNDTLSIINVILNHQ